MNEDMHLPPEPIEDWKIEVSLDGSDPRYATFTLYHQDHTLGNPLRYILSNMPEVEFVGYSVPHPSEPILKIRLQTFEQPAKAVLLLAFKKLKSSYIELKNSFEDAVELDVSTS